jgi:serine/threonine-protein kinase
MLNKIGHYEIVQELGRGGMGVVYKGFEPTLNRYVAIKTLSESLAHDASIVERFMREARSMASLNDPHIIQIYFVGEEKGQPFFAMEFVEGESLSQRLKREHRLGATESLQILLQTAQGLATAHDRGVIHRDIKPANLMITKRGLVKVADFGIALANHDPGKKLTGTGEFVGTPGYLSPEVCMGKAVDQRSDLFSLGIVLFEMLAGRMPFNEISPLGMMLEVVQSEIPDIRTLNNEVDANVFAILQRMVSKDPNHRYQTCHELVADLIAIGVNPAAAGATPRSTGNIGAPGPVSAISAVPIQKVNHPASATPTSNPSLSAATVAAGQTFGKTPTPPPIEAFTRPSQAQAPMPPPVVQSQKSSNLLPIAAILTLLLGGGGFAAYHFRDKLGLGEKPVRSATVASTQTSATASELVAANTASTESGSSGSLLTSLLGQSNDAKSAATETKSVDATTQVASQISAAGNVEAATVLSQQSGVKPEAEAVKAEDTTRAELEAMKAELAQLKQSQTSTTNAGPEPRANNLRAIAEQAGGRRQIREEVTQVAKAGPSPYSGAPSGKVLVVGLGNPGAAIAAASAISDAISSEGYTVVDAELLPGINRFLGDRDPDLSGLAQLAKQRGIDVIVTARIKVAGQTQLTFYGQNQTQFNTTLTVKAVDVQKLASVHNFTTSLDFTSLNAGDNTREAVDQTLGTLLRKLQPFRARG